MNVALVFAFSLFSPCNSILLDSNSSLVTVKEFRELVDLIYEENRLRSDLEHEVGNLQQRLVKSEIDYSTLQNRYGQLSIEYNDLKASNDRLVGKYADFIHANQSIQTSLATAHADIVELQQKTGYESAFTAWSPSSNSVTDPVIFSTVLTNIGSHYDSSTGKFTCQYPGIYMFTLCLYKYPSSSYSYARCYIKRNGSSKVYAYNYPYSNAISGSYEATNSIVMHLKHGDVVTVGSCSGYVYTYSSFTGFLVKADWVQTLQNSHAKICEQILLQTVLVGIYNHVNKIHNSKHV